MLRRVAEAIPIPKHENRGIWVGYLPHITHVLERQLTTGKGVAELLSKAGCSFQALGQYREAEMIHQRALEGREEALGDDHPETLASINSLGLAPLNQGRYKEAEALHRRALKGREKVLGHDHPDTLVSISSLGVALHYQRQYKEAEALHRRALEGQEKALGCDHYNTLVCAHFLGSAIKMQERYEEAEAMYRRAADGLEKILGRDNPNTVRVLNNLSLFLIKQNMRGLAGNIRPIIRTLSRF